MVAGDLLSVPILYIIPSIYENFRCAVEAKDELLQPEALKMKLLDEYNARKNKNMIRMHKSSCLSNLNTIGIYQLINIRREKKILKIRMQKEENSGTNAVVPVSRYYKFCIWNTGIKILSRYYIYNTAKRHGIAERFKHSVVVMTRCVLHSQSYLIGTFWTEAIATALYTYKK